MSIEWLWKRLGIAVGLTGLAGVLWAASLWFDAQRTLPRHPDPQAGRIYALNVHGIVVYQTHAERKHLDTIQYSAIALFGASALMAAIYQKFMRPTR
jgi:hypothetical protein